MSQSYDLSFQVCHPAKPISPLCEHSFPHVFLLYHFGNYYYCFGFSYHCYYYYGRMRTVVGVDADGEVDVCCDCDDQAAVAENCQCCLLELEVSYLIPYCLQEYFEEQWKQGYSGDEIVVYGLDAAGDVELDIAYYACSTFGVASVEVAYFDIYLAENNVVGFALGFFDTFNDEVDDLVLHL